MQIEEQFQLNEDDLVLTQKDTNPLIFGTITRNIVSAMIDADVFTIFLDANEMKKDFGDKKDAVMSNLLQKSQGIQSQFGNAIGNIHRPDWLTRFFDNLPFPKEEILICNLPNDRLSQKVMAGEPIKTLDERNLRKKEAREDIFVYAGFMQPGKHQILIKDKPPPTPSCPEPESNLYCREIVVDIRRRDIEPHPAPNLYKKTLNLSLSTSVARPYRLHLTLTR